MIGFWSSRFVGQYEPLSPARVTPPTSTGHYRTTTIPGTFRRLLDVRVYNPESKQSCVTGPRFLPPGFSCIRSTFRVTENVGSVLSVCRGEGTVG